MLDLRLSGPDPALRSVRSRERSVTPGRTRTTSATSTRPTDDQGPATWMPSYSSARRRYVGEWLAVKLRWRLTVDTAEKNALVSLGERLPRRDDHRHPGDLTSAIAAASSATPSTMAPLGEGRRSRRSARRGPRRRAGTGATPYTPDAAPARPPRPRPPRRGPAAARRPGAGRPRSPAGSSSGSRVGAARPAARRGGAGRPGASGAGAGRTRRGRGSRRTSAGRCTGEPRSAAILAAATGVDQVRRHDQPAEPQPGRERLAGRSRRRRPGPARGPAWRRSAPGRSGTPRRSRPRSRARRAPAPSAAPRPATPADSTPPVGHWCDGVRTTASASDRVERVDPDAVRVDRDADHARARPPRRAARRVVVGDGSSTASRRGAAPRPAPGSAARCPGRSRCRSRRCSGCADGAADPVEVVGERRRAAPARRGRRGSRSARSASR